MFEKFIEMYERGALGDGDIEGIFNFLFGIISNPSKCIYSHNKDNGILIGRAIWVVTKLIDIVSENKTVIENIFTGISIALINENSDLSVQLISCLALITVSKLLLEKFFPTMVSTTENKDLNKTLTFNNEHLPKVLEKLINLIQICPEETLIYPVDTLMGVIKV